MKRTTLILGALVAALAGSTPALAQMAGDAAMAGDNGMKMSKSQMATMKRCKAMKNSMMMKNRTCMAMMKAHPNMMHTGKM